LFKWFWLRRKKIEEVPVEKSRREFVTHVQGPRQGGKTQALAKYVTELQDEGADLVAVLVPNMQQAEDWTRRLVREFEIDPSRFMLLTPLSAYQSRGYRFKFAGVDNADWFKPGELRDVLNVILPGDLDAHFVITYTDPTAL
jgi:hypothetical protein